MSPPMKSDRLDERSWMPSDALVSLQIAPEHVALVVVDHGSRREASNRLLEDITDSICRNSEFSIVEPAHMELAEPSISTAFRRCIDQGARLIVVHPFFLLPGRHWDEDIPRLAAAAAAAHAGLQYLVTAPLGADDSIIDVVHARVTHCMQHAAGIADSCQLCRDEMKCDVR